MQSFKEVNEIVQYEKQKYGDYFIHCYKTGDKVEIYRDSETGMFNVVIIPIQKLDYRNKQEFPFLSNGSIYTNSKMKNKKSLNFNTARLNSISPYLYNEQLQILGEKNFSRIRYISIEDIILLCKRILANYYKKGGRFIVTIGKRNPGKYGRN